MRNPNLMHECITQTQLFHMKSMDTMLKGRGMERIEAEVEKMNGMSDSVSSFTLWCWNEQEKCKNERQPAVRCMSQHAARPNHRPTC